MIQPVRCSELDLSLMDVMHVLTVLVCNVFMALSRED